MQWISLNDTVYFLDTDEEYLEAKAALNASGRPSVPVYVGDPDTPECYKNGQILFADDEGDAHA